MATYANKTIFSFWNWDIPMAARIFVLITLSMLLSYINSKDEKDEKRKHLQILTWIAIGINILFILKLFFRPPPPSTVVSNTQAAAWNSVAKSASRLSTHGTAKANAARIKGLGYSERL